jgi:Predicted nucleotide-binding protein containing TIR-like domain
LNTKFRVYVSAPAESNLSNRQKQFAQKIVKKIEAADLIPQSLNVAGHSMGVENFHFGGMQRLMECSQGAVILAFSQRVAQRKRDGVLLNDIGDSPSEYNHLEGGLAIAGRKPQLAIYEEGVMDRGILWSGGERMIRIPSSASPKWLDTPDFETTFNVWADQVKARNHVFLAYCSKAEDVANKIIIFLNGINNRLAILNWKDFLPAESILTRIEQAAHASVCGIFLFTKDDELLLGDSNKAAPRDNVILEAGYFIRAHGKKRTLIIREAGSKMPADLGGDIYLNLPDTRNVSEIHTDIRRFLENVLGKEGLPSEKVC